MDYQVTCIRKPHPQSPHEHITHIGNPPTWIMTREDAIASIDAKINAFYVVDPASGRKAYIGVMRDGVHAPYLRTYADGYWRDNLLSLNQCPI
jgi:hypothetical protein